MVQKDFLAETPQICWHELETAVFCLYKKWLKAYMLDGEGICAMNLWLVPLLLFLEGFGRVSLMQAMEMKHFKVYEHIEKNVRLCHVVMTDNFEKVHQALEDGANPNVLDSNGITCLMQTARASRNLNIMCLLLEYGADISCVDKKGRTVQTHAFERYMFENPCDGFNAENTRWFLKVPINVDWLEYLITVPDMCDYITTYIPLLSDIEPDGKRYAYYQFEAQAALLFEQMDLLSRVQLKRNGNLDQMDE